MFSWDLLSHHTLPYDQQEVSVAIIPANHFVPINVANRQ